MNLFIQEAAEEDVLCQVEWYAEQGLPEIAQRFAHSVKASIQSLLASPQAGAPRKTGNPALSDLRTWPVHGFRYFRVFYLLRGDLLQVVRVLHTRRDTVVILEEQAVDDTPTE